MGGFLEFGIHQWDLSHLFEDLALCCCVHSCQDPVNGGDGDHDDGGQNYCDHNDAVGGQNKGHHYDGTDPTSQFTLRYQSQYVRAKNIDVNNVCLTLFACWSSVIVDDSGAMPRL